jgi:hypothetical protein
VLKKFGFMLLIKVATNICRIKKILKNREKHEILLQFYLYML